jgi:type VI secretion system protein ImpC
MMSAGEKETQAAEEQVASSSILDSMLEAMPKAVERDEAEDMVKNLIGVAMAGTLTWDKSCTNTIRNAIAAVDNKMSTQLAAIMRNDQFQNWKVPGEDFITSSTTLKPARS